MRVYSFKEVDELTKQGHIVGGLNVITIMCYYKV